jgi:hypothetical protein
MTQRTISVICLLLGLFLICLSVTFLLSWEWGILALGFCFIIVGIALDGPVGDAIDAHKEESRK